MLDLELNIKIQASKPDNDQLAEAFAVSLESFAAAIRAGGVPKQLNIKGADVNAILEVQATTSYINSLERGVLNDIAKAKAKLASPSISNEERGLWTQMLSDLEETLQGIREGDDGSQSIRMFDLGPNGFDNSHP